MPYRTTDDRIDGLVITFFNLSDLKQVESKLHETEQMNLSLLNSSSSAILKLSLDRKIVEFNLSAEKIFGKKRSEIINQDFITTFIPKEFHKKTEKELQVLIGNMVESKIKMKIITNDGIIKLAEWSVIILLNHLKLPAGLLLIKK
jgi:two-component system CheB/CheR fusion protein